MDLSSAENKLRNGSYQSDRDFEHDINLIWNNAMLFNPEHTMVHNFSLKMKEHFERLIKTEVNDLKTKDSRKSSEIKKKDHIYHLSLME